MARLPAREPCELRLGMYFDARYGTADGGAVTANIPFARFAHELGGHFASMTLFGRLSEETFPHTLVPAPNLVGLPDYPRVRPLSLARVAVATGRRMWRGLDDVDAVLVFGPHPFAVMLAAFATVRRRTVFVGVRQDSAAYFARRLDGRRRRAVGGALRLLEQTFRGMSRRLATVVVGTDLAARYGGRHCPPIVTAFCQLRSDEMVRRPTEVRPPPWNLLSVGRIEPEKNPALLVEVMRELELRRPGAFRLRWVGAGQSAAHVTELVTRYGLGDAVSFFGYVPFGNALIHLYRSAFAFVHVSHTEGLPQVLFEAMGSCAPVIATDVGGVRDAIDDTVTGLLVPPDDVDALVAAILRIADDPQLRDRLARRGLERARPAALDVEARRLAGELAGRAQPPALRTRVVAVADTLGVPALLRRMAATPRLTVLAYHRVEHRSAVVPFNPHLLSATPESFARQMSWFAKNFDVLTLDQFHAVLRGEMRSPAHPALVTFDDGYADNRRHAFPVLARLGLPAVVFVATDAIDTRQPHWWDRLAVIVAGAPAGAHDLPLVGPWTLDRPESRRAALGRLGTALKRVSAERREAAIAAMEVRWEVDLPPTPMMTWDDARELHRAGVAVAPHTRSHPILTELDAGDVSREIVESCARITAEIGTCPPVFAYPNGSYDATVRQVTGQVGIAVAFTMAPGPASLRHVRANPLEVPRIAIEADDDDAAFRLKASGILPLVRRARRLGVTA